MVAITTVGLDIAKSVFQVHGIDAHGSVVVRRQLKRRYVLAFFKKLPPSLVGIEACATSHHWSRELQALGHTVRLIPPAYVKPYVKRHKNDAADAVSSRPSLRALSPVGSPTFDGARYGVNAMLALSQLPLEGASNPQPGHAQVSQQ
jgi:transposase